MNRPKRLNRHAIGRSVQRPDGVALIMVLLLLIVVTLLGLASLRGALLEERMSAGMFDRSLAFQAAETALRVAEQVVREAVVSGRSIGVNCATAGVLCPGTPAGVETGGAAGCSQGAPGCWTSVVGKSSYSDAAAGAPQYYIEYMGEFSSTSQDEGAGRSASSYQYGASPASHGKSVYRISARSNDSGGSRAAVALQATLELR
ncbi:PilX N-terminal domain-containing pilus assembly protein [Luteibacter sp.]|uniref:pilus assembly PilX family protein n=1 Tax=Luteibacter sp. TaxID=1886636 RepID=UPI0028099059|nr:PilX N-terminal domain-containing pilus assembly protein [Luteibacter sp.]MDQ8051258.1 PilX N-terminal domain-containing pilus assembly protein [Luteibacter sp.]